MHMSDSMHTCIIYMFMQVMSLLSGCMDDRGTQHSIGQQFVATDCHQCFCGDGGSISCDQTQCGSSTSSKLNTCSMAIKAECFFT